MELLPNEIILHILSFCDDISIIKLRLCNKKFKYIIDVCDIWSQKLKKEFPLRCVNPMLNYYMTLKKVKNNFFSQHFSNIMSKKRFYLVCKTDKLPINIIRDRYGDYYIAANHLIVKFTDLDHLTKLRINEKIGNAGDLGFVFNNPYPYPTYKDYLREIMHALISDAVQLDKNKRLIKWCYLNIKLEHMSALGYMFLTEERIEREKVKLLMDCGIVKTVAAINHNTEF